MRIIVWHPSRKVNHLNKVIWDRKIITEFTRSISSTRIGKPVLMMDIKVSKDKNISRWVDRENLIYVRWNRIKNRAPSWRRWSVEEKEVRQSEVKPVKNISKNLQSFFNINCETMHMSAIIWLRFTINKIRTKASSIHKAKL